MENKNKRPRTTGITNEELKLTPGEELLIWRKRQDWNQIKAAKHYKVSVFTYKLAEYDKTDKFEYAPIHIYPLEPHEKCLIYRKRSGIKQKDLTLQVGCGVYWLRLQEKGKVSADRLLNWWEMQ